MGRAAQQKAQSVNSGPLGCIWEDGLSDIQKRNGRAWDESGGQKHWAEITVKRGSVFVDGVHIVGFHDALS